MNTPASSRGASYILIGVLMALALRAQSTSTWTPTNGSAFNTAANWSPSGIPGNTTTAVFTSGVSSGNVTITNSPSSPSIAGLSFTGSYPHYFFSSNGGTLSLGAGGLSADATGSGVDFVNGLTVTLTANQTWTTNGNVNMNGTVSGGTMAFTKAGTGYLNLSGSSNSFGNVTVSAGTLFLGQGGSAGSGSISVQSGGALAPTSNDITLSNNLSVASGATLGGGLNGSSSMALSGTVTLGSSAMTLNLGSSDVKFVSGLTAPAGTSLTLHSNGLGAAIMNAASANVTSITVDNAAVGFVSAATLPSGSLQASNGGYIGIADTTSTTTGQVLGLITNKAAYNGIIGFDTQNSNGGGNSTPNSFTAPIDLTGFTSGQVQIGSASQAILTPTAVITPAGQSYDFGGYAGNRGFLVVQSALADHGGATSVNVTSPSASGGGAQNGLILLLQGNNSYTGNLSVTNSAVLLDSSTALPSTGTFSMGANSYVGYTESAGYATFADFVAKLGTSYTATSVLGIDSHAALAGFIGGGSGGSRTITDATLDLSSLNPVYLGSVTGTTINSTAIKAPNDGVLRLTALGDNAPFTINTNLTQANESSVVVGTPGVQGEVILNGTSTYTGGTTLLGGTLVVGNGSALGTGTITIGSASGSSGNINVLAASTNGTTLMNNIAITDYLALGTGAAVTNNGVTTFTADTHSVSLAGNISDVAGHSGRLYVTTPATISGTNTYSGGTYLEANTTVSTDSGLGTSFVDLGYGATLTLTSAHPGIGVLANAGSFIQGAGTGNLVLGGGVTDLTINQASGSIYSGTITGSANVIKNGSGSLTLAGANGGGSFTGSVALNAGTLQIGDGSTTTTSFGSNIATASGTTVVFRPATNITMPYNATISGSANVAVTGSSNSTLYVGGGTSNFTGTTSLSGSKLELAADNVWSSSSPFSISSGTLQIDGNQTLVNLSASGGASIVLPNAGKALTINEVSATTISSVITGNGSLVKTGVGTLALTSNSVFTGTTSVTGGTLQLGNGTNTGALAGPVDLASGTTLALSRGGTSSLGTTITGNGSVVLTNGTLTMTGVANTYSGGTSINGGTLIFSSNANLGAATGGITFNSGAGTSTLQIGTNATIGTMTRPITFSSAGTINTNGANVTLAGALGGSGTFTKAGNGAVVLTGSSPGFTGATQVNGGMLNVDGNLTNSAATVGGVAKLFGSGRIGGITSSAGSVVGAATAGNAPATFFVGNLSLGASTRLDVLMTDATGAAGTGYSFLNVNNLSLAGISIVPLTYAAGVPAPMVNFDPAQSYSFTLATSGTAITGFNASSVTIDKSGIQNVNSGNWSVALSADQLSLLLKYSPVTVPEPGVTALLAGVAAGAVVVMVRRRKGTGEKKTG